MVVWARAPNKPLASVASRVGQLFSLAELGFSSALGGFLKEKAEAVSVKKLSCASSAESGICGVGQALLPYSRIAG